MSKALTRLDGRRCSVENVFFSSLQVVQIKTSTVSSQPGLLIVYKCYGLNESIEVFSFVVGTFKQMCVCPGMFVYQYQSVYCTYSNGMCILLHYAACFSYVV